MFPHFLTAQDPVYSTVLTELRAGDKRTHWMWFIFPQLEALGRSPMPKYYGLQDLDAARAYLADPVLGPRLRECVATVLAVADRTAHQIFHSPDDLKFRSCLTLFEAAASADKSLQWSDLSREGHETYGRMAQRAASPTDPVFPAALTKFYAGERDPLTLELLGQG